MSDKNLSLELAQCLEWMEKTGRSPEAAAKRFPHHYQELIQLLQTVKQLDAAEKPAPSQEFLSVARTRLLNQINAESLAVQPSNVTKAQPIRPIWQSDKTGRLATSRQPQRRFAMNWILIIGMIASVLAGGGGVAYASTDALPGDGLYPVKTMLQDMELVFANDEQDVELLMAQMMTNIQEMQQLAEQERYTDMLAGLDEYQSNLEAMNQVRARVNYDDAGSENSLNTRLQQQLQTCTELLEQLQTRLQTRLQTQDKLQTRLQEAIQNTDNGNTYGPNENPGQPEEPGEPNGPGPGEPQGTQNQEQKPEEPGNPDGCQGENCNIEKTPRAPEEKPGNGSGNGSGGDSGSGGGGGKP